MQLELSLADRVSIMRKAFIPSYPITVMVVSIENQLHGYIRRYCFLRGRKKGMKEIPWMEWVAEWCVHHHVPHQYASWVAN